MGDSWGISISLAERMGDISACGTSPALLLASVALKIGSKPLWLNWV